MYYFTLPSSAVDTPPSPTAAGSGTDVWLPLQHTAPPLPPPVVERVTDVWQAAEQDMSPRLRQLLLERPDLLNARDDVLGLTPAIHASAKDAVDSLCVLASLGADLNARGRRGVSCVFAAATTGSLRTLDFLISAGASLDDECDDESALEWLGRPLRTTRNGYTSRLHGDRFVAAQKLLAAGAYVDTGTIVHKPSRLLLHRWVLSRLANAAGLHAFVTGLSDRHASALTNIDIGGIPESIGSYLERDTPRELRRLTQVAWIWRPPT